MRRKGFIIGVDHYLRLQELLNKLSPDCEPADLKYLLCPIFAVSGKQQQQFYHVFDSYFKPLEASIELAKKSQTVKPGKKETVESSEKSVNLSKLLQILGVVVLIILSLVSISLWRIKVEEKIEFSKSHAETKPKVEMKSEDNKKTEIEQKTEITGFLKYLFYFSSMGLLAYCIIFLLIENYDNRRRLILVKQRGNKPPFVWPIKIESPGMDFMKNHTGGFLSIWRLSVGII